MKKLLVVAAMICIVSPTYAADFEICAKVGGVAREVMEKRQNGTTLLKCMSYAKIHGEKYKESAGQQEFYEVLCKRAFRAAKYSTYEFQQAAVDRFENKFVLSCLNRGGK